MKTLNYFSVSATTSPLSQEPAPPAPRSPRETKVILPKKKPLKWSTGVAPGDYGGPPTTSKLRKYWGRQDDDPLTSDDFIWNKNFMPRMKKLIEEPCLPTTPTPEQEPSGFLSISRVMTLDSLEVDFSKELTASSKPAMEATVASAAKTTSGISGKWKLGATRIEQEKWDKATKAATGGTDMMLQEVRQPREDAQVLAAESRKQYYKLKKKLQILTLGIGGVGLVSAYVSYSPEIAASFGTGLLGSLVYMRMLGSSVDSMADGARGLMKGAIAQPRLLVPVALVMICNRWNALVVPQLGLMHLELVPVLVGFFTYKIATFFQAIEDVVSVVERKT